MVAKFMCAHYRRPAIGFLSRVRAFAPCIHTSYTSQKRYNASKPVRIGCSSGFWGDTAVSAPQLIHTGKLDFLVSDYLSEITMSLMTAMKRKNPDMGYAPDFVQVAVAPYLKAIKQKGIRVVSNAGGVNPHSCAAALKQITEGANIDLNIAVVTGDDLMPQVKEVAAKGVKEIQSGAAFPSTVNSMNAYLGAGPIARALDLGADIVITGRCVDSALVLGPLIHSFNWKFDEFDKLAAGSLAGHLVECGAQSTGGIFTDWYKVKDWANIGFPVVECQTDGSFTLTKPPGTGGLVSRATVGEQLLYEIGDPTQYLLPDVSCDFSNVKLEQVTDGESVMVTGAKGNPPPADYKVSATYADGYRITAVACVGGPRAKDKAEATAAAIIKRCKGIFRMLKLEDFSKIHIEALGTEHNYGPRSHLPQSPRECVLWLAAHHSQKKALEVLAREIAPAGTGMAPGLTGIAGGRPSVSPVLKLFSFLHDKSEVKVDIYMNGEMKETYSTPDVPTATYTVSDSADEEPGQPLPSGTHTYRLEELAYTRSGDKGNSANIGVMARHPAVLPYLKEALTEASVQDYFSHLFEGELGPHGKYVHRYDVPGIDAMNFVLHNVLGGGGIASLRSDPQGKGYGQMLLDFEIAGVPDLRALMQS